MAEQAIANGGNVGARGAAEKFSAALARLRRKALTLLSGPEELLGVDIGSHAVKLAAVKRVPGGNWALDFWGYAPIPGPIDAAPDDRHEAASRALAGLVAARKPRLKQAAVAVAGDSVIVRHLSFDYLTRAEFRLRLKELVEKYLNFDLNDAAIDGDISREFAQEGRRKIDAAVGAAKSGVVAAALSAMDRAGLETAVIDVDPFALENVFNALGVEEPGSSSLLLNLGHSVTNLSIVEGGTTRVARDIRIAGRAVTKAVMQALQVEAPQAEEAKRQWGLLLSPEEKENARAAGAPEAVLASEAAEKELSDLAAQVRHTLHSYLEGQEAEGEESPAPAAVADARAAPGRRVGRVFLCGGTAKLKNAAEFFAQALKLPTSVLDLSPFVDPGCGFPLEMGPDFIVAAGLALRLKGDWS